jgi:hypothetical protein
MENIITREKYLKLKTLLDSNDPQNIDLVINIIDNCSIEKSFPHLLNLYTKHKNIKYTFASTISRSKKLLNFIHSLNNKIITEVYANDNKSQFNLKSVLMLYDAYVSQYTRNKDKEFIKKERQMLINEFTGTHRNLINLTSKQLKNKNVRNNQKNTK